MLVRDERVFSAGGDERRATFVKFKMLSLDVEHSSAFEHDVDLVVCVRALVVGLRRDKRVDTDVKPPRFVDGLVTTIGGAQARFGSADIENAGRLHRMALRFGDYRERAPAGCANPLGWRSTCRRSLS